MSIGEELAKALYDAVEFGTPTLIRIGPEQWTELIADRNMVTWLDRPDMDEWRFQNVKVEIERDREAFAVEHDGRYMRDNQLVDL